MSSSRRNASRTGVRETRNASANSCSERWSPRTLLLVRRSSTICDASCAGKADGSDSALRRLRFKVSVFFFKIPSSCSVGRKKSALYDHDDCTFHILAFIGIKYDYAPWREIFSNVLHARLSDPKLQC